MSSNGRKKPEPWRIVVFALAILWIIFMWVRKDLASIGTAVPREQLLPLLATTLGVSLLKAAAIAGAVLFLKWLAGKSKNK